MKKKNGKKIIITITIAKISTITIIIIKMNAHSKSVAY